MKFLAEDNNVKILGRSLCKDGVRYLGYSSSGIEFEFEGKLLQAVISTDNFNNEERLNAWIAVFINDELIPSKRIELKEKKATYELYKSDVKKV
ncbi:hypothetical protein [uncultured Clostridium sp.]|uniref:hypothetical protein n=1 Tax=uncultured Clostridium sp. TaxID=59620 RepID=UPI0025F2B2EC|nr:hypothetical protein [uncultured Clostridium sp.]